MRRALSRALENSTTASLILLGCRATESSIFSIVSGRRRIISTAESMRAMLLFTSWRRSESFCFNSRTCSTLKVTGSDGKDIRGISRNLGGKQAWKRKKAGEDFPRLLLKDWRLPTLAEAIQPLPSALQCLTAVFGMGTGRTTAVLPPKIDNKDRAR